jgi:sortase A
MGRNRTNRIVRRIECGLVVVGVACLLWAGATSLSAFLYQVEHSVWPETLDHSLDHPVAVRAAHAVEAAVEAPAPIGRLEIPRIGLSVVVAEGDDENILKVAVGHLPDTSLPWQEGNTAVAGHRDTFFRPLRSIQAGDDIRFVTRHGTFRYRVSRHTVVEPDALWVLDASPVAALTLITCYPFDDVGPAPRRFIVHAERMANVSESSYETATREGNTR